MNASNAKKKHVNALPLGNASVTHHGEKHVTDNYTHSMWKHRQANGHELLITAWFNDEGLIVEMNIAERPSMFSTWGPPTRFEKVEN